MTVADTERAPAAWRAWCYLVWLSFQRQARAHLMVWIALGLLAFSVFLIVLQTQMRGWTMAPRRVGGVPLGQHLGQATLAARLPWPAPAAAVVEMARGAFDAGLSRASGFYVFSNWVLFPIFTAFLLPLWSLSFATEGLGREREGQNILWVLTRPLSRPAIYLAKFVALLPWCLALNVGGFALMCLAAGPTGRVALGLYWPAVVWGTLAFASLFHLMGACLARPATVALLYAFFLETVVLLLPDDYKKLSLSYYVRCLMSERAAEVGVSLGRTELAQVVGGTTAALVLAGATVGFAVVGAFFFTRNEYLDVG